MPSLEPIAGLGPIDIAPAYEVVVAYLRRGIHLGEFPPGCKLPSERDLAEQLGVSRATLREALRELKGAGYVDIRRGPGGGVFVRQRTMSGAELRTWFAEQGTEMDAVFEFRAVVEPLAARRAAARADTVLIAELSALNERMATTTEVGAFRQADLRFHLRIAEAAGADLVRHAVEEARAALFLPFQPLDLDQMRERTVPEHERIVQGLKDADAAAAATAMEQHVRGTAHALASGSRRG
ncbi:FadR/GntR family transcriptional regulator [Baekduia soli]|uniref:FadR/GntR family transcriptional regulator n=1 Tax=Baekduia soli TaxID=496014 RepID=UPI001651C919|nr:FCD domain-containing protein [Baekduia soli]